jgi:TetR/AcrR family transcriptional regulator
MQELSKKAARKQEIQAYKRQKILLAAADLFREKGLDGTTMRAIATKAGYSTGAPYAYYQSKEEIYADLLGRSLTELMQAIRQAKNENLAPADNIYNVFKAYFHFYLTHLEDLQLGLYLFSPGEVKKRGFSKETNSQLNGKLIALLGFMANCLHEQSDISAEKAQIETLDATTHITGTLMLQATGRLATFNADPEEMIDRYLHQMLNRLGL